MIVAKEHTPLNISLFDDCASEDMNEIERQKKMLNFSNGECIFCENSLALGVYCLLNGGAKIIKKDYQCQERIVSVAKKGDVLGLRSVIDQTNFTASAVAIVNSSCCFIPKENILKVIEKYPGINLKIMIS
ncbi:MAG: cyclic nucleotide-binding domain-containing protein, partial [Nitrosopumilaceae archaeon]|nr:cyclic nucleotide-binding domain-containing protein [Nitrosopumilaceae archaeon]NIX60253.1 cyclic nucleotide-binding domain-containing protein [Nitrosopumilaceae archaeon]